MRGPVVATALLFATNGAVFGALVPRLPDLKDALGIGPAAFGLAMACFPAGALLGGLLTPAAMRWRSDGAVAVAGMVLASVIAALVGLSPSAVVFGVLLLAFGLCDAATDVAMNAHGIRVQLRHGRSLINRFHATWSLGAVVGALGGSVAAGVGAPVVGQMIVVAAVCTAVVLAAVPLRLPGESGVVPAAEAVPAVEAVPDAARRTPGGRALLLLLALGLLAACAALVEDFAQNWAALHLRDVAAMSAGLAGAGFIAVQGAQLAGRLAGDRLVDAVGTATIARTGGLCVVAGTGAALLASFTLDGGVLTVVLLVGFALAGWGIATIIPGAMLAADSVPGLVPGVGLAVQNWTMRVGFLVAPPLVGLLVELAGMRWAVAPLVVAGVLIAVLSGPLLGRLDRPQRSADAEEVRP